MRCSFSSEPVDVGLRASVEREVVQVGGETVVGLRSNVG
jgi:hypothetical protein